MNRTPLINDLPLEDALFVLPEEGLRDAASALGRTRLRTFVNVRYMAIIGQTIAVLLTYYVFNFEINLSACLAIIAASAWLNVALSSFFPGQRLAKEGESFLQLAFDTCQLAALLTVTGGLSQPFLFFMIAPVTIAAVSLPLRYSIALAALALGLTAAMPFISEPLPWLQGSALFLPPLLQWGHFSALAVGIAFFTFFANRVSRDEARLVQALDAAQVVMAREQRLSALGSMAAMTAHELGTPLATIHLVARELAGQMDGKAPFIEDVTLIAEQAERCRTILQKLAKNGQSEDIHHAQMPFSALVEEAAAPHRGLGVSVHITTRKAPDADHKLPIVRRRPEILHALGAFIENAVSFACEEVHIDALWSASEFTVTIRDDGPGFSSDVLPRLGEPYVSERSAAHLGGGDMGLGFFIAKTLVERTRGRIATRNRNEPAQGAIVKIVWARDALEFRENETI